MNIAIILVTSLIVFMFSRLFFIFLYWILGKLFKTSTDNVKFDLGMSIAYYFIYIQAFLGASLGVAKNIELSYAEWYFICTFIGISSMLWCYFSWDMKFKAKPIFGLNDKQVIAKKITVFAVVMIISFVNGYGTMCKDYFGKELFPEIKILNATMIVGIIAFDRLLNQVANYKKIKLQEQVQKQDKERK